MKSSSNYNMDQVFIYLKNIKIIDPDVNMYSKTFDKIKSKNLISVFWVKSVACILILFISSEIYIISKKERKYDKDILTIIITKTNNNLYDE